MRTTLTFAQYSRVELGEVAHANEAELIFRLSEINQLLDNLSFDLQAGIQVEAEQNRSDLAKHFGVSPEADVATLIYLKLMEVYGPNGNGWLQWYGSTKRVYMSTEVYPSLGVQSATLPETVLARYRPL